MRKSHRRNSTSRPTIQNSKKARFKVISTETVDDPDSAPVQDVARISFTSSAKGYAKMKNKLSRVYLDPAEIMRPTADYPAMDDKLNFVNSLMSDSYQEEGTPVSGKDKVKRVRADIRSSNKMRNWLPYRTETLDEYIRYIGGEDPIEDEEISCVVCGKAPATVRCRDCRGRRLHCSACIVARHCDIPLHRLEMWNGRMFERTSLEALGMVIQLGHHGGTCPCPSPKPRRLVVCDLTGLHELRVSFCECSDATGDVAYEWVQIIRYGWFPATNNRPATAFTFDLLDFFQELNLQAKTNLYDFCKTIERVTDNSGAFVLPTRYKQMSHVSRIWRHLSMLRRGGRAHDPSGPDGTCEGDLAVECPACPHPGRNLPPGWESAPPETRWLYTLFLMLDANFRAKNKARGLDAFELGPGWSYFVEETKYQVYLRTQGEQKETSTCNAEHNAIRNADIRKEGYDASGVGAVLCARHALVRRNGAGDLQLGERYANMDYLFFSTLMGVIIVIILVSYDIACQWYRNLLRRMLGFPPSMQVNADISLRFAIPKKHFRVHGPHHSRFSLNLVQHVGRTYGEGIESQWSSLNPIALSAREMSSGVRHELLNDHWGGWNWQKIVGFPSFFAKALHDATNMFKKQEHAFNLYSSTFAPEVVAQWKASVVTWHEDMSAPDPYEEPQTKVSLSAVRLQLANEEAAEAQQGLFPSHDTTPAVFLQVGLELEEQQRSIRLSTVSGTSNKSQAELLEKRTQARRRIELWQAIQDIYMPMVAPLRSGASASPATASAQMDHAPAFPSSSFPIPTSPTIAPTDSLPPASALLNPQTPHNAEDIPLWLPSALPLSSLSSPLLGGLRQKESRLRVGQLSDSLDDIRRLRRVLTNITEFKRLNISNTGQRALTRIRNLYARFQLKIQRAVERYRAARAAMEKLEEGGEWSSTYRVLADADVRGPGRDDDEQSEGRHEESWIWLSGGSTTQSENAAEFAESMRVEWARFSARVDRWSEECALLREEMRRVVEYLTHRADWWRRQSDLRAGDAALRRGLRAYAERQATVLEGLRTRCVTLWIPCLSRHGPLPAWAVPYEAQVDRRAAGCVRTIPRVTYVLPDDVSETAAESDESDSL